MTGLADATTRCLHGGARTAVEARKDGEAKILADAVSVFKGLFHLPLPHLTVVGAALMRSWMARYEAGLMTWSWVRSARSSSTTTKVSGPSELAHWKPLPPYFWPHLRSGSSASGALWWLKARYHLHHTWHVGKGT